MMSLKQQVKLQQYYMKTRFKNEYISKEDYVAYIDSWTNKIFKIIPICEEYPETVTKCIASTVRELIGTKELFLVLNNNSYLISIISTLTYFTCNSYSEEELKTEVKKCLRILNNIKRELLKSSDGKTNGGE